MTQAEREQRIAEAAELGGFPLVAASIPRGAEVELMLFREGRRVHRVRGWYVCRFLDDDPDAGRGVTDRIVGTDGQVWEGSLAVQVRL